MSSAPIKSAPATSPVSIEHSRQFCEQLTRQAAKNFYYGLKLLPEPKRSAMFALYAYMRLVDDIADDEDGRSLPQRLEALESWRLATHAAIGEEGSVPVSLGAHQLWPAFAQVARQYHIPPMVFDEVIAGQRQDLEPRPFENFQQLKQYCGRVAGVVGIASIHIWGFEGGADTEERANDLGVAFQLTNILRDLREDAARKRIYLPLDELRAAGLSEEDVLAGRDGEKFLAMMRQQIERAEHYYHKAAPLMGRIERDCRPTLAAMIGIYHGLLKKVAARPQRVLHCRVSLSLASKLYIGWRALRTQ